ncbi:MAG TPA: C45 family autoproteolytic acyltransferase/hydrolase [Chitinophagaceae bacterium]|nr:C45 family autoproteolytic acyltransferase/hydrolase [Chitinophagaceae bacterium]HNF71609.1 C45 family autoproteolytic acyltransferase/hydrolase [Chitinophagaceae bacterium]
MWKKLGKFVLILFIILLLLLTLLGLYVYSVSDLPEPRVKNSILETQERKQGGNGFYTLKNNWIRKNRYGVYEMYLEGNAYDRGLAFGKLARELIRYQELVFTNEIKRMVPSNRYRHFLKYVVGFMNRNLPDHVTREYQEEIFGVSKAASDEFNWIGTRYSRQLNYHAAHDIGHALANLMLVGCSSFAAWDQHTNDGTLLLGRNFDFYSGEDFAKNKIIIFCKPEQGIPYCSVSWPGFCGVVSGMNLNGITVTINAARSDIPLGAATPVSLLAREILQYAGTLDEAIAIAKKRTLFVSESFMIGSGREHKAILIEKTPKAFDIQEPDQQQLICTNHYQGPTLKNQKLNQEQMQQSASVYRFNRLRELLQQEPLSPSVAAGILRNPYGLQGKDIGLCNEKTMNQFLAHHSVIFKPESLKLWVSTSPWQEGAYVCYDLKKVFAIPVRDAVHEIDEVADSIASDAFMKTDSFRQLLTFRALRIKFHYKEKVEAASLYQSNPLYYDALRMAGDQYVLNKQSDSAAMMYQKALQMEIATEGERASIQKKWEQLNHGR